MRGRALGAVGAAALALGLIAPAVANADTGNGVGNCHAYWVDLAKDAANTNSAEGAADQFAAGGSVRAGQEEISQFCGQS